MLLSSARSSLGLQGPTSVQQLQQHSCVPLDPSWGGFASRAKTFYTDHPGLCTLARRSAFSLYVERGETHLFILVFAQVQQDVYRLILQILKFREEAGHESAKICLAVVSWIRGESDEEIVELAALQGEFQYRSAVPDRRN